MKKFLALLLALGMIIAFTACGGGSEDASDGGSGDAAEEEKTYGVGDTWTVDGQWNFTIDSVEVTEERNEFEESDPEQVIIIKYHYENLGYEDSLGLMDGLYFYPDSLIDSDGNMCNEYPVDTEFPQETPVGAKCSASVAFGLVKAGSPVTLNVEQYDGDNNEQKATFILEF